MKKKGGLTLNIEIDTDTLGNGAEKLNSFTALIENLSKEEACHGMSELTISAKMSNYGTVKGENHARQ